MWYAEIIDHLLQVYLGLCLLSLVLAHRDQDRPTAVQAFIYGLVIFMFNLAFSGQARKWGFWWYGWEGFADFCLLGMAFLIWRYLGALCSWWVMWIGMVALAVDLTFMGFSASGYRLPGIWYFRVSNVLEVAQVLSLVLFTGPALRAMDGARKLGASAIHELKRMLPWTHNRSFKRA